MTAIMSQIKNMAMENSNGNQEIVTKVTIIQMRDKDTEQWNGLMEVNIKGIGFKEFSTELV